MVPPIPRPERAPRALALLLFASSLVAGCEEDRPPPGDPGGGGLPPGGGGMSGGGDGDGGASGDDDDDDDDGETICRAIPDGDPNGFVASEFGGAVVGGEPARLGVFWDCFGRPAEDGARGQLLVVLGDGSDCFFATPGALSMRILASELGGLVATGASVNLSPDVGFVDPVEMSFFRDPDGGGVIEEWGTCSPLTTGTITFENASDVAGEPFQIMDLDATLQPCGDGADPPIVIDATIEFDLPSTFADVCSG